MSLSNHFSLETQRLLREMYSPRSREIDRGAHNSGDTFQDDADAWLINYAAAHGSFTASMCTNAARLAGLESDHGAWGAVFKRAKAAGIIRRIGYAQRKNGNPAPLYIGIDGYICD